MGISVSIVNPSLISREGLRRIVADGGIDVHSASSCVEDLPELPADTEHLVVVDVPSLSEQLSSLRILSEREHSRALVLTEKFDLSSMLSCFDNGAQGYAVKDMPCDTLIVLLQLAALGHKVMPSDLADVLRSEDFRFTPANPSPEREDDRSNLSQRENDVLCCLMAGFSNKRIARKLEVTEATVKVHVKAILRKLNVANRTQAAMWATSRGFPGSAQPEQRAV